MKKFLLIFFLILFGFNSAHSASWEIQQARQEYTQGAYSKCLLTLNKIIDNNSYKDVEAYKLRGQALMKLNSPISAIKDFNVVIELKPTIEAYNERAYAYLKAKDYQKAISDFDKTINSTNEGRYAIKGLKAIANDVNIPVQFRYIAAYYGLANINKALYGNGAPEHLIPQMKAIRLLAETNENDEIFKNKSKKEIIKEMRESFSKNNSNDNNSPDSSLEIAQGYFEYAFGNKELGRKIIYGALNEIITETSPNQREKFSKALNDDISRVLKGIDSPSF